MSTESKSAIKSERLLAVHAARMNVSTRAIEFVDAFEAEVLTGQKADYEAMDRTMSSLSAAVVEYRRCLRELE